MTDLEWREAPGGWKCRGYTIRRLDGRRPSWLLETTDRPASSRAHVSTASSVHPSLRAAKTWAVLSERQRVRRNRERADGVVAIASSTAFVILVPWIGSLFVFLAAVFSLSLALRSSADALTARLGSAWEWTRAIDGPERIAWSARLVMAAIESSHRRAAADRHSEAPPAVRVLPAGPV